MQEMWSGPDDPNFSVLRFTTERYNIFLTDGCKEAAGAL
jgi:general stress protein 26